MKDSLLLIAAGAAALFLLNKNSGGTPGDSGGGGSATTTNTTYNITMPDGTPGYAPPPRGTVTPQQADGGYIGTSYSTLGGKTYIGNYSSEVPLVTNVFGIQVPISQMPQSSGKASVLGVPETSVSSRSSGGGGGSRSSNGTGSNMSVAPNMSVSKNMSAASSQIGTSRSVIGVGNQSRSFSGSYSTSKKSVFNS